MAFETFVEAASYVWALPYGIGKLFSIGGLFYVGIKGKHFLSDVKKEEQQ